MLPIRVDIYRLPLHSAIFNLPFDNTFDSWWKAKNILVIYLKFKGIHSLNVLFFVFFILLTFHSISLSLRTSRALTRYYFSLIFYPFTNCSHSFSFFQYFSCLVGWSCRIQQQYLCREVRPLPLNEWPGCVNKVISMVRL